ncbi:hypothetical protein FHT82_002451 [Rhizobium sp. BK275]|uniref:hypothetical protein n=1 Tax=Rhizobium sp. BK275 TaxID=2587077 RepID=UPI00160918BF|nr:hypothetical protein [Rhizobium sp. BK275]MBB3389711.1 hypothetical protein [Rhizobium sp. BK275]
MARPSRRKPQRQAAKEPSLGSALDEIGFKPLGHRIKIKHGVDQVKLRLRLIANIAEERGT